MEKWKCQFQNQVRLKKWYYGVVKRPQSLKSPRRFSKQHNLFNASSPASFPAVLSLVINAKNINSFLIEYIYKHIKSQKLFPRFSFFLKTALNEFQTNRGHSESWNLPAPKGAKCWITVVIEPENELRLHTHHHNTILQTQVYLL